MQTSVGNLGAGASADDFPIVITAMPANARQYKIAFRGFAILVVVVAIVMLANIQIVRVDSLIPAIQIVMCLADLLTAAFLFAQYSVQPRRALLALASGFVFSGLFAFLQTLAFPGAYGSGVVIGVVRAGCFCLGTPRSRSPLSSMCWRRMRAKPPTGPADRPGLLLASPSHAWSRLQPG